MLTALNQAFAGIRVSEGYDVLYNAAGTCYRLTSPTGHLVVEEVKESDLAAVLAETGTRLVFRDDVSALKAKSADAVAELLLQRKLEVQGDGGQLRALKLELEPYYQGLQREVDQQAKSLGIAADSESVQSFLEEVAATERATRTDGNGVPGFVPAAMVRRMVGGEEVVEYAMVSDKYMKQPNLKWLMFSAFSTSMGNVGQSNYSSANIFMEGVTYHKRTATPFHSACTMQWGVVGGIGMRVKAFGSQDIMVNTVAESEYLTLEDSRRILATMLTTRLNIENVLANVMDAATRAAILAQTPTPGEGPALSTPDASLADGRREKSPQEESQPAPPQPTQSTESPSGAQTGPVNEEATAAESGPVHLIAGTWDDWVAHAMEWDAAQGCLVYKVCIDQPGPAGFQVVRGSSDKHQAKTRRLRSTKPAYTIQRAVAGELLEVRVFLKEGGCGAKRVDWVSHGVPSAKAVSVC